MMTERKLLMIPGPINFDPSVLRALSTPTPSMLSPSFTKAFGEALTDLRKVVFTEKAQPIVVAGSGYGDYIVVNGDSPTEVVMGGRWRGGKLLFQEPIASVMPEDIGRPAA